MTRQDAINDLVAIIRNSKRRFISLQGLTRPSKKEQSLRVDYFMLHTQATQLHCRQDYKDEYFFGEYERINRLYEALEERFREAAADREQPEASPPLPPDSSAVVAATEPPVATSRRGGRRPGAGRKRIGETRRLSLTFPPDWWETIDAITRHDGRPYADVIRELLYAYFSRAEN